MTPRSRATIGDILRGTAISTLLLVVPFAPALGGYAAGGRRQRPASSAALVGFGVGLCGVLPLVGLVAVAFGPLADPAGLGVGSAFLGVVPVSSAPPVGFPVVGAALAGYYLCCGTLGGWLAAVTGVGDGRSSVQSPEL